MLAQMGLLIAALATIWLLFDATCTIGDDV